MASGGVRIANLAGVDRLVGTIGIMYDRPNKEYVPGIGPTSRQFD
jgi:hypothetical protein